MKSKRNKADDPERLAGDLIERLDVESLDRGDSMEGYRAFLRELLARVRERIEAIGEELGE